MQQENKAPDSQVAEFKRHAATIIEFHLGKRAKRLEFKASGLSNFVFAATHADGKFMVRISPDPNRLDLFIKEQWAQAQAAKAGVPIAPILEVAAVAVPHPYMISSSVDGVEATKCGDRAAVLKELGGYAALVNTVRTRGFGETFDWSENKLSYNATFAEYLDNEYRFLERVENLERARMIDKPIAKRLRAIYRELKALKSRPRLSHGDIRLKNALVDKNDRIIAILDWEKATSNLSPHWELSVALHDLSIDEMHWFLAGYGVSGKKLEEIAPYVKAFNILNYCAEVDTALDSNDRATLKRIRLRFSGALDLYSIAR
jgi:aminoglycoside phosphotransferase (APT) family kinase protein